MTQTQANEMLIETDLIGQRVRTIKVGAFTEEIEGTLRGVIHRPDCSFMFGLVDPGDGTPIREVPLCGIVCIDPNRRWIDDDGPAEVTTENRNLYAFLRGIQRHAGICQPWSDLEFQGALDKHPSQWPDELATVVSLAEGIIKEIAFTPEERSGV